MLVNLFLILVPIALQNLQDRMRKRKSSYDRVQAPPYTFFSFVWKKSPVRAWHHFNLILGFSTSLNKWLSKKYRFYMVLLYTFQNIWLITPKNALKTAVFMDENFLLPTYLVSLLTYFTILEVHKVISSHV